MYLLGDIGNTETKICLVDLNFQIIKKIVYSTKDIQSKNFFKKNSFAYINKKLNRALFCSVVPKAFKKIRLILSKKKIKVYELKNKNLKSNLKIKVNKIQIGSDRLANAMGAMDNKKNCIVIDFGTATTFDVIVKKNYLGGVIAPGVNLSLNTLSLKASLIPHMKLNKVSKVIGKNTKNAVQSGFYWGYIGLIKNIVRLIKNQTRKNFKIILTGGLSYLFKDSIDMKNSVDKDLTIKGLMNLLKLNV